MCQCISSPIIVTYVCLSSHQLIFFSFRKSFIPMLRQERSNCVLFFSAIGKPLSEQVYLTSCLVAVILSQTNAHFWLTDWQTMLTQTLGSHSVLAKGAAVTLLPQAHDFPLPWSKMQTHPEAVIAHRALMWNMPGSVCWHSIPRQQSWWNVWHT